MRALRSTYRQGTAHSAQAPRGCPARHQHCSSQKRPTTLLRANSRDPRRPKILRHDVFEPLLASSLTERYRTLLWTYFLQLAHFVVRFRVLVVVAWIALTIVTAMTLPTLGSEVNNDNSQFLPSSAPEPRGGDARRTAARQGHEHRGQVMIVADEPRIARPGADQAALAREVPRFNGAAGDWRQGSRESPDRRAAEVCSSVRGNESDVPPKRPSPTLRRPSQDRMHQKLCALILPGHRDERRQPGKRNEVRNKTEMFSSSSSSSCCCSSSAHCSPHCSRSCRRPSPSSFRCASLAASALMASRSPRSPAVVDRAAPWRGHRLRALPRVPGTRGDPLGPRGQDAVARASCASASRSARRRDGDLRPLDPFTRHLWHLSGPCIPLAIGIAVTLVAALTLLPALLAIFGNAVFWPSPLGGDANREGTWGTVAGSLVRRPALTLGIGLVIFAGLALGALGYHSGGFGGALNAPAGNRAPQRVTPSSRSTSRRRVRIRRTSSSPSRSRSGSPDGGLAAEAVLSSSGAFRQLAGPIQPERHDALAERLRHAPRRTRATERALPDRAGGTSDTAASYNAYRSTALFVSPDGRTIQFAATLAVGGQQSTAALNATPHDPCNRRRPRRRRRAPRTTGSQAKPPALYDVSSASNRDLIHIVPIAILAIALLLALVLRSLIAPLYLIVSVAISYLAALGVSTILFIDLGHSGGLTFILPFLMFIFLLALGRTTTSWS